MKKYQLVVSIICLFVCVSAFAQETYIFKEGLIVNPGYRYGREALYKDELAWQLYNNSIKTPAAGQVFGNNEKGESVSWKAIKADSLNRLRSGGGFGFGRGGSYIYLTYTARERTGGDTQYKR